jgi:glycogen synthase
MPAGDAASGQQRDARPNGLTVTDAGDARPAVLIVASWFPSVDDPSAGRFVADQADALAAAGVFRPAAITFDVARLTGGATSRGRQATAVLASNAAATARADPLFVTPAWGVDAAVPVARLSIPEGLTTAAGSAHGAVHREGALLALARRLGDVVGLGVVHAHTGYPDGAAAIALADRLGWPLVVTEHASFVDRLIEDPARRERYAAMLGRAHRLFAVSSTLAGELRAAYPEHAETIAVLPNAVPVDVFPTVPLAERRPDELLFVGYRKASKGMENLLSAVAVARARRPSITLRLVGRTADEAEERTWHDLARALGIADAVSFEHSTDRAGVAAAMARASVFVHPSPRETFGVVAVEALASGMPVVATDSGGVTEILGDDPWRLGALVPVHDHEALGAAIIATLERRETFDPTELRASVERRFGAAFVVERLHVAYREAMAAQGGNVALVSNPIADLVGSIAPIHRAIVVVLDREQASLRLRSLPEAARSALTVLTAVEPAGVVPPAVGRLVEVAVDPSWRPPAGPVKAARRGRVGRLARLASDPLGTIRRRLGRDAGSDRSLIPATAALRHLAGELPEAEIITVDGHDVIAAAPVLAAAPARRSTGGLRRLADRWAKSP